MHRFWRATRKSAFPVALAAGLALIGIACGGGGGNDTEADESGTASAPANSGSESLALSMGDNFFDLDGARNPTLELAAGDAIEIALTNDGAAIHNMRFAGEDNQFNTSDDAVSDPNIVPGAQTATLEFTVPENGGTYSYQCDFHPTDMKGTINAE